MYCRCCYHCVSLITPSHASLEVPSKTRCTAVLPQRLPFIPAPQTSLLQMYGGRGSYCPRGELLHGGDLLQCKNTVKMHLLNYCVPANSKRSTIASQNTRCIEKTNYCKWRAIIFTNYGVQSLRWCATAELLHPWGGQPLHPSTAAPSPGKHANTYSYLHTHVYKHTHTVIHLYT